MKLFRLTVFSMILLSLIATTSFADFSNGSMDPGPAPAITDYPGLNSGALFTATAYIRYSDASPNVETANYASNSDIYSIINSFDSKKLKEQFPDFDKNTSAISATASLRGIAAYLNTYVQSGVRYLDFCFVINGGRTCADFSQQLSDASSFAKIIVNGHVLENAPSTKDVFQQLVDWLKGQGGGLLNELASAWVSQTSLDPVGGNPNSFMAQLTNENFNLAATNTVNGDSAHLNLFTLAPSYMNYTNNGYTVKSMYLPLRWSHFFSSDNALIIDMPLNYSQIAQATTYSAALGLGFMHTFIRQAHLIWSLTPSFYAGAVGSVDMASGTGMYDGALASRLTLPYGKITYGMTNDISYLKTAAVTIGSVTTPYKMSNTMTQNGIDATYKFDSDKYSVGGFYTRTDVLAGQSWYIPDYNQVGFKLAKLKGYQNALYDHMALTVGYLFAIHNFNGVNGTLTFNF